MNWRSHSFLASYFFHAKFFKFQAKTFIKGYVWQIVTLYKQRRRATLTVCTALFSCHSPLEWNSFSRQKFPWCDNHIGHNEAPDIENEERQTVLPMAHSQFWWNFDLVSLENRRRWNCLLFNTEIMSYFSVTMKTVSLKTKSDARSN